MHDVRNGEISVWADFSITMHSICVAMIGDLTLKTTKLVKTPVGK